MEVDYTQGYSENEIQMFRNFMNTKLNIYQPQDGYVIRTNKVMKFNESFEHIQMQNNASNILMSVSSTLLYSLVKDIDGFQTSRESLRKVFRQNDVPSKEYDADYIEKKYAEFKRAAMLKKLANDPEYLRLCEFIDSPRFDITARTNITFLRFVLNHKYFVYHPRYEELSEKYRKFLCPMYRDQSSDDNLYGDQPSDDNNQ